MYFVSHVIFVRDGQSSSCIFARIQVKHNLGKLLVPGLSIFSSQDQVEAFFNLLIGKDAIPERTKAERLISWCNYLKRLTWTEDGCPLWLPSGSRISIGDNPWNQDHPPRDSVSDGNNKPIPCLCSAQWYHDIYNNNVSWLIGLAFPYAFLNCVYSSHRSKRSFGWWPPFWRIAHGKRAWLLVLLHRRRLYGNDRRLFFEG